MFERRYIFQTIIFGIYVWFRGCISIIFSQLFYPTKAGAENQPKQTKQQRKLLRQQLFFCLDFLEDLHLVGWGEQRQQKPYVDVPLEVRING